MGVFVFSDFAPPIITFIIGKIMLTPNKDKKGNYFSAMRVAYVGVFCALSFVLYLLDFPLLPSVVPFLKFDFSNVLVTIAGFALGPVSAVIVLVIKELLHALTLGQTFFVGELANVLLTLPYVLITSLAYKKSKTIKTAVLSLSVGSVAQTAVSFPISWLITFPVYMQVFADMAWADGMAFYLSVWYWGILFNVIKTVIISACVLLLYKHVSNLIKFINKKFGRE